MKTMINNMKISLRW